MFHSTYFWSTLLSLFQHPSGCLRGYTDRQWKTFVQSTHFKIREKWNLLRTGTIHGCEVFGFNALIFLTWCAVCLFRWQTLLTAALLPGSVLQRDWRQGTHLLPLVGAWEVCPTSSPLCCTKCFLFFRVPYYSIAQWILVVSQIPDR